MMLAFMVLCLFLAPYTSAASGHITQRWPLECPTGFSKLQVSFSYCNLCAQLLVGSLAYLGLSIWLAVLYPCLDLAMRLLSLGSLDGTFESGLGSGHCQARATELGGFQVLPL